jgi:phospholipid/cholesterol/gamma-HCH transport system substrate-binding protein
MTRSLSRWQAVVLGVLVFVGLWVGAFGVFAIGSRNPAGVPDFLAHWLRPESFHLRAGFQQVQGVEVGTRVRVKGVEAGEVETVERPGKPSGEVVLVLRINARHRDWVRADAFAQIVPEGMVGGKVIEINPGSDDAPAIDDGAAIKTKATAGIGDVLAKLDGTLQGIHDGQGSMGRFFKDDEVYNETLRLVQQGRRTMSSLQQNSDAIKEMPWVRSYVTDMHKLLVRPDCERNRRVFVEADLFEPGQAILTAEGRRRLDEMASWVNGLKHRGSEVVVAAYAHPSLEPEVARTLTHKQSVAVTDYLTDRYSVQKMGWFSSRKVTPLGCGVEAPPLPERDKLPAPRVEVIVFVPQQVN